MDTLREEAQLARETRVPGQQRGPVVKQNEKGGFWRGQAFGQRRASAILDTRRRLLGTRIVLPRSVKTGNSPLRLLTAGRARSFLSAFTLCELPLNDTLEQQRFLVPVE